MIWVAKNLYFFNCLLDGAHTKLVRQPFLFSLLGQIPNKNSSGISTFPLPEFLILLLPAPC